MSLSTAMSRLSLKLLARSEDWSKNRYIQHILPSARSDTLQAKAVLQAFQAERSFLLMTTKAKKPDPMNGDIIGEIHKHISTVDDIKVTNRGSDQFNQLSMVGEGIVGLGWIMEGRPADYVDSALGGTQYYGNKVLKEFKEK